MIRKDFSRSFLRMGYDASEVLSFLVDIERTITGEETDPEKVITAQKAEDQEFSVKWRGFNDEEVDMEIASASRRRRTPSRPRRLLFRPSLPRPRRRWLHLRSPRRLPPLRRCPR